MSPATGGGPPPHRLAVLSLEPAGAPGTATRSVPVEVGDQVVSVNGEALPHESFEDARMALVFARQEAKELVVVLARSVPLDDDHDGDAAAAAAGGRARERRPSIGDDSEPVMTQPKARWQAAGRKVQLGVAAEKAKGGETATKEEKAAAQKKKKEGAGPEEDGGFSNLFASAGAVVTDATKAVSASGLAAALGLERARGPQTPPAGAARPAAGGAARRASRVEGEIDAPAGGGGGADVFLLGEGRDVGATRAAHEAHGDRQNLIAERRGGTDERDARRQKRRRRSERKRRKVERRASRAAEKEAQAGDAAAATAAAAHMAAFREARQHARAAAGDEVAQFIVNQRRESRRVTGGGGGGGDDGNDGGDDDGGGGGGGLLSVLGGVQVTKKNKVP